MRIRHGRRGGACRGVGEREVAGELAREKGGVWGGQERGGEEIECPNTRLLYSSTLYLNNYKTSKLYMLCCNPQIKLVDMDSGTHACY